MLPFHRQLIPRTSSPPNGRDATAARQNQQKSLGCRWGVWLLALLMLPLSQLAQAHSETSMAPLRVGVLHIPPLSMVRSSTDVQGPLVEYIHQLLQHAKLPYQIEGFPARRLYRNLGEGKSQFWIGVKHVPQYEGKVLYSEQPVCYLHLRLYRLASTPEIQQLSQLQNQRLIVIRGYSYGGQLEPLKQRPQGLQGLDANDNHIALEMLTMHRADYLLTYAEPIGELKAEYPDLFRELQQTPLDTLPMYLVLNRQTPQAESLMKQLNQSAETLRQQGETARIFARLSF